MLPLRGPPKKSRAKSCTSCRQVKLRCDAKEKYPGPCSRCTTNKLECRMDSNFKRVNVRRIETSSNGQLVDPINQSTSEPIDFGISNVHAPNVDGLTILDMRHSAQQSQPSIQNDSPAGNQVMEEKWLDLDADSFSSTLTWPIGELQIANDVVVSLFQQFDEYYYHHMPIIEPVKSLHHLHEASPALFWVIAFTASRHHPQHSQLYQQIRDPFSQLFVDLLKHPILTLKDLQAVITICHWPVEVVSQTEDPSWMYSGLAVNSALHMGLDKLEDEVLFGHRRVKHSLRSSDSRYRKRTWMKCFQISTQLSSWQGLRPQICSAPCLRRLASLYDETSAAQDFIAMTEIQRQVARYTTVLDEAANSGFPVSLVHHLIHDLDAIQDRFRSTWSIEAEINIQGAKLYLLATCLLSENDQTWAPTGSDSAVFFSTILQCGHAAALSLIQIVAKLGLTDTQDPSCSSQSTGGSPLLAHPKHHLKLAFFACTFLLKFLDCNRMASTSDKDAARNAVSTTFQLFNQFTSRVEILRAAKTMEVLGRAVVPGLARIGAEVKTRVGASLMFNAIWTAAKLRGRQYDPEFSAEASSQQSENNYNATSESVFFQSTNSTAATAQPEISTMAQALDNYFPWGIWDDDAFDALRLGWDGESYPNVSEEIGLLI